MKNITGTFAAIFISQLLFAGNAELSGQVKDDAGKPIDFASVVIESNGSQRGMNTDEDGFYSFKPLEPGTYTLTVSFLGMRTVIIPNIVLSEDDQRTINITMEVTLLDIDVDIRPTPEGLFDPTNAYVPTSIPEEAFGKLALSHENPIEIVPILTPGVYVPDRGGPLHFSGSRDDASVFIVDGVKVIGRLGLITNAIKNMVVYNGGMPAKYGDSIGGVVVITTKGYTVF